LNNFDVRFQGAFTSFDLELFAFRREGKLEDLKTRQLCSRRGVRFCFSSLHREVRLSSGDLGFARVAVHGSRVRRVPREAIFVDHSRKNPVLIGLLDCLVEVFPFRVSQQRHQISSRTVHPISAAYLLRLLEW
jgi:hypothetical protein